MVLGTSQARLLISKIKHSPGSYIICTLRTVCRVLMMPFSETSIASTKVGCGDILVFLLFPFPILEPVVMTRPNHIKFDQ